MSARRLAALRAGLASAVLLGAAAAFAPVERGPVSAAAVCSVDPPIKHSAKRTRDIVRRAKVVVRATALHYVAAPPESDRPGERYVAFAVREVLSGDVISDTLSFDGILEDRDSLRDEDEEVPYLDYFRWYAGTCAAMTYRAGAEYLLLLNTRRDSRELTPYWVILAPTNEQIRGRDDRWVVWVRQTLNAPADSAR